MDTQDRRNQFLFLSSLLLAGLSIRVYGDVYLTEILFSIYGVISLITGKRVFASPPLNRIPLFFILWVFANFFSSLFSGKDSTRTLIAVGTVIIFGLSLRTVIEFFSAYPDQVLNAFVYFLLGRILGIFINPLPYTEQYLWKFGYGEWIVLLLLTVVAKTKVIQFLWFGLPILIIVSLANEARTIAFLCVGVFLMSAFSSGRQIRLSTLILLGLIPILSYYGYLAVALGGHLGASELSRAQVLSKSELGPLAARKEFIFSSRAFAASPIIGYGFDPQVSGKIIEAGQQQLVENGIVVNTADLSTLPMHSFLMSALVQGGIFAGFFWIFALFSSFRSALGANEVSKFLRPLSIYVSLALIDRILFSPFGAFERLNACFFVGFILNSNLNRDSNEK